MNGMPKSRNRRKKPQASTRKVKLAPEAMEAIKGQLQRFREKFGRDPGPNDPIWFDTDADEPVQMSGVRMQADILEALRKAGTPPEIAYAYRKTGLLSLGGDMSRWPKDHIEEWEAAVAEYHLVEQAKRDGGPKPEGWYTEIPELLVSDLCQEDFDHVQACLRAMAPVEASRPMKLAARIELAAAALATTCEHAFESAHATGHPERAMELYEKAEELVIRRARELYAQGP
jgi:hypothetical protein